MYNFKFLFSYWTNNKHKNLYFENDFKNQDFEASVVNENNTISLKINPIKPIKIEILELQTVYKFQKNSKLFLNGYQSWTDSKEFDIKDKMSGINQIPKPLVKKYQFDKYGDYSFKKYPNKKGCLHGFSYAYIKNQNELDFIGSLTEKNGYTIINFDSNKNKIIIEKDCKGLEISNQYNAFDLTFLKGTEDEVFEKYFSLMNIKKPNVTPKTGYTSWYHHYQNINEKIIIDNLNAISDFENKLDIFQIDDGYQTAVGDWLSIDEKKFPNGMKIIADKIKEKDLIAGLWLAPFVCEKTSEIFKNHPDWILKNNSRNDVMAGSNWSGFYALDLYNSEVRNYIRNVFDVVINQWGYDLVKLDFLYAVCLLPRKDKTRGQIMCEAMEFLRECVGDKLILGCGVPLAPAFGKVDFCRIGCDIGLDWNDKPLMRLLHRERISTRNAITNSIYRKHLDGRAFLNDPDVFLLRNENIKLSQEQKEALSMINGLFGSLLFTSDEVSKYDEHKLQLFSKTLECQNAKIISITNSKSIATISYVLNNNTNSFAIDLKKGTLKYLIE